MAPAFGSFTAVNTGGTSGTTATVACPSGTQTDDLLLFLSCNDAPNLYSSGPSGSTLITQPTANSNDLGSGSWFKVATSADVPGTTTYTVTKTGATSVQPRLLVCVRYTGIATSGLAIGSTKFGLTAANRPTGVLKSANAASDLPTNPSSILATDLIVRIYMFGSDATNSGFTMSAAPAGWTQRGSGSTITNTATKFNVGMLICDQTGTTSPGTSTITTSVAGMYDIYTFAIPALLSSPGQFLPFFNHHDDELLERRSSGLYVQRHKIAGVRPDGGRDRVLVRAGR